MRYAVAALGGLLALIIFVWAHKHSLGYGREQAQLVMSTDKCEPVTCVRL